MRPYAIEVQHPDDFVGNLFDLDAAAVIAAARKQRAQLKNPPLDPDQFLEVLRRQGLANTAQLLASHHARL